MPSNSRVFLIAASLLVTAETAIAQERRENMFDSDVAATLRAAARVYVYTSDGKQIVGSRANLGLETLDLWVDGALRAFEIPALARIDVAQRDSLKNGAVTGAIVFGLLCALSCGQGLDEPGQLRGTIAINTVLGALIGTGIDAAKRDRRTVYIRSAVSPTVGARGMLSYQRRF